MPYLRYRPPTQPQQYSVAYAFRLNPNDFGKSRSVHFNRANRALAADDVVSDPSFAAMMEETSPGWAEMLAAGETPDNWTWQHATTDQGARWLGGSRGPEAGWLHLVPSNATVPSLNQHVPGEPWWRLLHPLRWGAGGYSQWAVPSGAPKNR